MSSSRKNPVVWVVEQGAFDYSPAKVFAPEIRILAGDRLSPNAESSWHHRGITRLRKSLVDYIPGVDFVIPTGQPARMMMVAMLMMERGKVHNLLGWDDRSQRYMLYALDFRQHDVLSETMLKKSRFAKSNESI